MNPSEKYTDLDWTDVDKFTILLSVVIIGVLSMFLTRSIYFTPKNTLHASALKSRGQERPYRGKVKRGILGRGKDPCRRVSQLLCKNYTLSRNELYR